MSKRKPRREPPRGGTVRGTPIREYEATFTDAGYAFIARWYDEILTARAKRLCAATADRERKR